LNKKSYIKNYTLDGLQAELVNAKFPKYRAEQIYNQIYVNRKQSFADMKNLPKDLIEYLDENYKIQVFASQTMRKSWKRKLII